MKCQILLSGKNKKNIINLSSAENAQRVVKVNHPLLPCSREKKHQEKNIFCFYLHDRMEFVYIHLITST